MPSFDVIREVTAGLRNDLKSALHHPLTLPIRLVSLER